jgi:hypothetical protein
MKGHFIYHRDGSVTCFLEGKEVTREEFDAAFPAKLDDLLEEGQAPDGHRPSAWPMISDALAVHPKQIEQAMERNKRMGVAGVEYLQDGRAVLKDRGMRRDLNRVEGFHDNNGGYMD